jgi:DNA-binding MarR family transcriptional regulator
MALSAGDEIVRDCLAVRVRLIGRAVTSIYDRALDSHGLSIAQVNLLAALGKVGPCTPTQLGDVLQLERSTVSRNLTLLRKRGWIEAVSTDAKGLREVALTRTGYKKIESVLPDWRQAQQQAAELLGSAGAKAVRKMAGSLSYIPSD